MDFVHEFWIPTRPMNEPLTFHLTPDGIGWITFDDPDSRVNVYTPATVELFQAILEELGRDPRLKAVVIQSAKERIFIAGADLRWVESLDTIALAYKFARHGQAFLESIASFRVPVIAAIHGACAGGGFELSLACHYRIATDHPATRIGLPEVSLGTLPGWGSCVRLPRLIGLRVALVHILEARLLTASVALQQGLIDEIVPPEALQETARQAALRLAEGGAPTRFSRLETNPLTVASICDEVRHRYVSKTRGPHTAMLKTIEAIEIGANASLEDAFEVEAHCFSEATPTLECRNLIHVFYLREANRKTSLKEWFPDAAATPSPQPIHKVGVVGAGVMGAGIAHWVGSCGHEVYLRDVTPELVADGLKKIAALFQESVRRGKSSSLEARQGLARIHGVTDWAGFEDCDLVIEAVIENFGIKKSVFEELSNRVKTEAILATNTSAIPIQTLASLVAHPERVIGIHFFNPVSRMALVEIILGVQTGAAAAERAVAFSRAIGKQIVICRDSPGFIVNRILLPYLNRAAFLFAAGIPAGSIDEAMLDFGVPMGPLRLIDEVGVDVTQHIMVELAHYFGERMPVCDLFARMNEAGLKGRKVGRGFYIYDGAKATLNPASAHLDGVAAPMSPAPSNQQICDDLLAVMIGEARLCLAEGVARSEEDIDFAMITGTGFPAFRGGLLRYARQIDAASPAGSPS